MSIPLLLVCDGDESKQATLEGLVKSEAGLKYIATVSMQDGSRAVERAVKVGAKLIWIDLDQEPVEGLNLLAETRKLHPMLNIIVSRSQLDPDMVRAALQLGALDFLDPSRAKHQLNVVVENLNAAAQGQQAATPAAPVAPFASMPPPPPHASASGLGSNKWGDLDFIPTPGAVVKTVPVAQPAPTAAAIPAINQDVTGEIHVANSGIKDLVAPAAPAADSSNAPAAQPAAAAPGNGQSVGPTSDISTGSKWGDLDSIGTPAAKAQTPSVEPAPALQTAAPPPAPAVPPAPMPQQAEASPAAPQAAAPSPAAAQPGASGLNNATGSKWGDLDAIPTPKAVLEPAAAVAAHSTGEVDKPLSALDAIPTPSDKPAIPLPKPVPHSNTNKALRPSPEKAELYSMQSPIMLTIVIILIIFGAIAFVYFRGHH